MQQDINSLKPHQIIKLANERIEAANIKVGTQVELYTLQELRENKLDAILPYIIEGMERYFGIIDTISYVNNRQGLVGINRMKIYNLSPFWIKNIIHSEKQ